MVQELVHSLRKRKGKNGGMVAKIDLEKAYDRIDWNFLKEVLAKVGFSESLTNLIHFCISSIEISTLWNDKRLLAFSASREHRQGDPLSPLFFLFYV